MLAFCLTGAQADPHWPAFLPFASCFQNQLHDVARFKPMTATATTMVK